MSFDDRPANRQPVPAEDSSLLTLLMLQPTGSTLPLMMAVILSVLLTLSYCLRSGARPTTRDARVASPTARAGAVAPANGCASRGDRLLWAWLSRVATDWRSAVVIVTPETVIGWHRRRFRAINFKPGG